MILRARANGKWALSLCHAFHDYVTSVTSMKLCYEDRMDWRNHSGRHWVFVCLSGIPVLWRNVHDASA